MQMYRYIHLSTSLTKLGKFVILFEYVLWADYSTGQIGALKPITLYK